MAKIKQEHFDLVILATSHQVKTLTDKLLHGGRIDLSEAVSQAVGFECTATLDLNPLLRHAMERVEKAQGYEVGEATQ